MRYLGERRGEKVKVALRHPRFLPFSLLNYLRMLPLCPFCPFPVSSSPFVNYTCLGSRRNDNITALTNHDVLPRFTYDECKSNAKVKYVFPLNSSCSCNARRNTRTTALLAKRALFYKSMIVFNSNWAFRALRSMTPADTCHISD